MARFLITNDNMIPLERYKEIKVNIRVEYHTFYLVKEYSITVGRDTFKILNEKKDDPPILKMSKELSLENDILSRKTSLLEEALCRILSPKIENFINVEIKDDINFVDFSSTLRSYLDDALDSLPKDEDLYESITQAIFSEREKLKNKP